jgi:very-short-patch-repair endonuclease
VPPPCKPDALRGRVFRRTDVLSRGLLTEDALRSSAWRRLFRGIYADAELPDSYGLRIRGASLFLPPSAAFSGRSAAYLHGATELVDAHSLVDVTMPSPRRQGPVTGLRIHQVPLPSSDVCALNAQRTTTGLRTALDIARREPLTEAVTALDVLLARAVVGKGELREAAQADTARGARRVQQAVLLADPRAESQPESRLRVLLALAGLIAQPQYPVRNQDGTVVARVDLAFPDHRLAIEYDGAWHGDRRQFAKDRQRLNRLVAAGWTVIHVTAADLRDPGELVARIRALLSRPSFGELGV